MTAVIDLLVIEPNGDMRTVQTDGGHALLKTLYRELRCTYIDAVELADDLTMYVDDEGLLVESPVVNAFASYIAHQHGATHQRYMGTTAFVGGVDARGDDRSLSAETHARMLRMINEMQQAQ